MRQIKFRGKTIDTGEWVFGSLLISRNGYGVNYFIAHGKPNVLSYITDEGHHLSGSNVTEESVGQLIGLKNKKEIYHGDIIIAPKTEHFPYKRKGVILIKELGVYFSPIGATVGDYICKYQATFIMNSEIIGNIIDNKEITNVKN